VVARGGSTTAGTPGRKRERRVSRIDSLVAAVPATPTRASLRRRGGIAIVVLMVYLLATLAYGTLERTRLHRGIDAILAVTDHERELALTEAALRTTLIEVIEASQHAHPSPDAVSEMSLYMQSCVHLFDRLQRFDASYEPLALSLQASHAALGEHPERAGWMALRDTLGQVTHALEASHAGLSQQRLGLVRRYELQYDAVTFETGVLVLAGLLIFGVAATGFLGQLSAELRTLEGRILELAQVSRTQAAARQPTAAWQGNAEVRALDAALDQLAAQRLGDTVLPD
jgi:hypothetical protein